VDRVFGIVFREPWHVVDVSGVRHGGGNGFAQVAGEASSEKTDETIVSPLIVRQV
jgi:hypothetical protein